MVIEEAKGAFKRQKTVPLSCFVTVEPLVNLKLGTSQGSIKQRRADHFQLQEPEKAL
jgi:hypothetical protein